MKVCEYGQGLFFTIYFPGFVCFVLYLDKISGERLQDRWSSGWTELRPLINVKIWCLLNVLGLNGQNLTKFCILIITNEIYVGIVMQHQFITQSYAAEYIFVLW